MTSVRMSVNVPFSPLAPARTLLISAPPKPEAQRMCHGFLLLGGAQRP